MGSTNGKRQIKVMKLASWSSLETISLRWTEVWGCQIEEGLEIRRWNTVSYLKFQIDRVRSLKIVIFGITVIDEREEFHVREIFKLILTDIRLKNLHILIKYNAKIYL